MSDEEDAEEILEFMGMIDPEAQAELIREKEKLEQDEIERNEKLRRGIKVEEETKTFLDVIKEWFSRL